MEPARNSEWDQWNPHDHSYEPPKSPEDPVVVIEPGPRWPSYWPEDGLDSVKGIVANVSLVIPPARPKPDGMRKTESADVDKQQDGNDSHPVPPFHGLILSSPSPLF